MLPEIKVYKIDYEFIIKNYLDVSLWQKKWNLFIYKQFVFTLNLYSIDTKQNKILFEISTYDIDGYHRHEVISYDMKNTSLEILMKQINGAIFRLMERIELTAIQGTDGYLDICESRDIECEHLREIAEEYLDKNGVTNSDIRDVYIDNYVNKNKKIWLKLNNYEYYYQYNIYTDMFLTFCEITRDDNRLTSIKSCINHKDKLLEIEREVESYIENMDDEEFNEELIEELESI